MSCCTAARKKGLDQPQPRKHHIVNLIAHSAEGSEPRRSLNDPSGKRERLNLKRYVRQKLLYEIFEKGINEKLLARMKLKEQKQKSKKRPGMISQTRDRSFGLYILIMDTMGAEILNSCMRMTDLGQRKVAVVEKLELRRKPMPNMEAIYIMKPEEDSVLRLIEDFRDRDCALYKCAHVFFTRKLNSIYFDAIAGSPIASFIRTMKELNVAFIPEESQVFNLGMKNNIYDMYSPVGITADQHTAVDIMSEKILSLCQTVQMYPQIRYQSSPKAFFIAKLFGEKLDKYNQAVKHKLSKGCKSGENVLIILERNVDVPTVLLHSMTVEALVHDILPVEKGFYKFVFKNAKGEINERMAKLDETEDELWDEIRHLHIADALVTLPKMYKEFLLKNRLMSRDAPTLTDMSQILNDFPEYHKELLQFSLHMELTQKCLQPIQEYLLHVARAEQNVATGIDMHTKKPIASIMPELAPYLTDEDLDEMTKVRLIMLYATLKNGMPESDVDKIFDCADLPMRYKSHIINLSFMGLNILTRRRVAHNRPPVKDRPLAGKYESARWTPYVVDLIEDILDSNLRTDAFPIMPTESLNPLLEKDRTSNPDPTAALESDIDIANPKREERDHQHRHHSRVKRIIVCFIGGVTFPEMRSAHQIAAQREVDILIGGDDIITPIDFMGRVAGLRRWSALEESVSTVTASQGNGDASKQSRDISLNMNVHRGGGGGGGEVAEGEGRNKAKRGQLRDPTPNRDQATTKKNSGNLKFYWQENEQKNKTDKDKTTTESKKKSSFLSLLRGRGKN